VDLLVGLVEIDRAGSRKRLFQRVDLLCVDNSGFGNPTKGDRKQLLQLIELLLDLIGLVLGMPIDLLPIRLKK